MKAMRDLASRIHSLRLTLVRRSSSIIPIFMLFGCIWRNFSISVKTSFANFTSSGPCIFGLTIYTEPAVEFLMPDWRLISCCAIKTVHTASINPSPISSPCSSRILGVVIKCPTFRTSSKDLPLSVNFDPLDVVMSMSEFSCLFIIEPPLEKVVDKSPFIKPSQFL